MPPQDRVERAQHLIAIKNTPSWPVVRELLLEEIEKKSSVFFASTSLTDAELHYGRGHLQGLRYMLAMIENAENSYEKAKRQSLAGDEGVDS